MKTLRTCTVYFRPEGIYIFGLTNSPNGLISNVPSIKLPVDCPAPSLGTVLLEVLGQLKDEIVQVDLKLAGEKYRAHLKEMGFKSMNAFEKRAKVLSVGLTPSGMAEVLPYEPAERGGFLPLTKQARSSRI